MTAIAVAVLPLLMLSAPAWASAPAVTSVDVPPSGRYGPGRNLDFRVHFDQTVVVTGSPRLAVTLDQGGTRFATYVSGSNTTELLFRLPITAGVADADGVQLTPTIDLNGGAIQNSTGDSVTTTLNNVGDLTFVRVGGLLAYEPFVRDPSVVNVVSRTNDSSTGFTGPWVVVPTTGSSGRQAESVKLMTDSSSMAFPSNVSFEQPSTVPNDGKVRTSNTTNLWWPANVARPLAHPISLDEEGVIYITFLFRDASSPPDGQALMGFLTGVPSAHNDNSTQALTFGFAYGNRMGIDVGPANLMAFCDINNAGTNASTPSCMGGAGGYTATSGTQFANVSNQAGESWFVIAELTTVASGNDTLRLKAYGADDNVPASPPAVWDVVHTTPLTGTITHASVQLESRGTSELDEMRIASSYADVVGLTPAAPTNLTSDYVVGATSVTVSATAPTSTGGSTITGYLISATPTSGGPPITVFSAAPTATLTGLDPNVTYNFAVAAVNASGIGTAVGVDPAAAVAPAAPDVPTITSTTAGDAQAVVTVAPAGTGGIPDSYTVTSSPGGLTCTVSAPATSCTVTGLTNGTDYTFTATATNTLGTSAPSAASSAVTPVAPIVHPTPTVTGVSPNTGSAAGGGTLTITGTGFTAGATVSVGNQPCTNVTIVSATTLTCVAPAGTAGTTPDITVTNPGTATGTGSGLYTYASATPAALPSIEQPVGPGTAPDTPATPAPIPVEPGSDRLPSLDPGDTLVTENGLETPVELLIENQTDLVMRGQGFELRLTGDCNTGCVVRTDSQGRHVIEIEQRGSVLVSGEGFLPGTTIHVWLFSEPKFVGEFSVRMDGTFNGRLLLTDVEVGNHTLQVNGITLDNVVRSANLGVVVAPHPTSTEDGGVLPSTGASLDLLIRALLLLTVGAVLRWGRVSAMHQDNVRLRV